MVDFITDYGQLVLVTKSEDVQHVTAAEDSTHGVGGIDDKQKLAFRGDDLG